MHTTCAPLIRLVAIVTASALLGGGCTSMHPVAVVAPGAPQATAIVKVGDDVRVTMRDGRKAEFTVEQVDDSAITAEGGEKYATDEIVTLERSSVSAVKTTVLIVSSVAAAGVAFFILSGLAFVSIGH